MLTFSPNYNGTWVVILWAGKHICSYVNTDEFLNTSLLSYNEMLRR